MSKSCGRGQKAAIPRATGWSSTPQWRPWYQRSCPTRSATWGRRGLVWLTTPLVQLATELADQAGSQLVAKEAWLSSERSRPLDTPATRLADARQELMGDPAPEAAVALSV